MTVPRKSFAEMRAELARQRGRAIESEVAPERQLKSVPQAPEEDIPDVLPPRSDDDIQIDQIVEGIDVLDAYRRWIGKEVDERTTGQREGIKVSCPIPGHRDKHPSAWLNTDTKTWFCGGCQEGGDVFDLAAIKFGYARPDYKEGKTFHELRREMAESYGYRFKKVAGTEIIWREEGPSPASGTKAEPDASSGSEAGEPAGSASEQPTEPNASVTTLHEKDVEDELEELSYPTLDWRSFVPEDTFLREYLEATSNDSSPEEYHFFHGLLALAHAVGRKVHLPDQPAVYGNLLVCLLGGTGFGKSSSRRWLNTVLREVVPFRDNGLDTDGCKLVPVPASGENLIKQFQHIATDPSLPKGAPEVRTPVNGIVDYDEFASLLARANRQGSTLTQIVMGFSDANDEVTTASNTGGTLIAAEPFCSITASTQPKAVRALLSRTDASNGFLNRWLFVGGPRKKRSAFNGRAGRVDLTAAMDSLKRVRGWGAMEREVDLDDQAMAAFETWFQLVLDPTEVGDDTGLLNRVTLHMKRLLLLLAINRRSTTITIEDVNAVKILFDYLVQCYGIVNAEIGITQQTEIVNEILRHVKNIEDKTNHGASARDLAMRMKRKNYAPDAINKALKTMVELDWLDVEKPKGNVGRPTIRYKAVI